MFKEGEAVSGCLSPVSPPVISFFLAWRKESCADLKTAAVRRKLQRLLLEYRIFLAAIATNLQCVF